MSASMGCGRARRLSWPGLGPRKATDEILRAQAHVEECVDCRRALADMHAMSSAVSAGAARPSAPADVRERLFTALARARTAAPARPRAAGRWLRVALVGGVVLTAAVVGNEALKHLRPDAPLAGIVDDHLRAVRGEGIASSDSLLVAQWLEVRVPMPVAVPLFPGAALRGARLYVVDGSRGAVLEYELEGRTLTYYIVPVTHEAGRPANGLARVPELRHASRAGYRIVSWQDMGLVHALVADVPDVHLTRLAHYCMQQMMVAAGLLHRAPCPELCV